MGTGTGSGRVWFGVIATFAFIILGFLVLFVLSYLGVILMVSAVGIIGIIYVANQHRYQIAIVQGVFLTLFVLVGLSSLHFLSLSQGLEIQEIIQDVSFGIVIAYYARFIPVLIIFIIIYGLSFGLAVATQVRSFFKTITFIGYGLCVVIIMMTVLSFVAPQGYEQLVEIFNFVTIPYDIYYSVEIGSWTMSGYVFVTEFMSRAFVKGE